MAVANTLAYYNTVTIMDLKSFILQAQDREYNIYVLKSPNTLGTYRLPSFDPSRVPRVTL